MEVATAQTRSII